MTTPDRKTLGYWVSLTALLLLSASFIWDSSRNSDMYELAQGRSPEELKRAADTFTQNLAKENSSIPTTELVQTASFRELQDTLSHFSLRVEILEEQNRQRRRYTAYLVMLSFISMATFALLSRVHNGKTSNGAEAATPDNSDPAGQSQDYR